MSACPRPDKITYPSRRAAWGHLLAMPRKRRRGLYVYRCKCGAYHLGRLIRRARVAWRAEP